MSSCLKIGHRLLNGDQIISALVQYKLLETLVGQVLLDEVVKEIPVSQQELFQILIGTTEETPPDNLERFLSQWCEQRGVTLEYFNTVILRDFRVRKFKHLHFANRVESEFLRVKTDLDLVEYSLLRVTDLPLAQELYFQLRDDGAEFTQLARQYSLGNERETGGRIGPVSLSTLPDAISTLFSNEQIGVIYGPVPIDDEFWIVQLEQFTPARLTETTRTNLINRMYNQWLQVQVKKVLGTPGMLAVQPDEQLQNQNDFLPVAS